MPNYLHEKTLNNAVSKLYMLGNRPVSSGRSKQSSIGDIASGAAAAMGSPRKKKTRPGESTEASEWDSGSPQYERMKEVSYSNTPAGLMPSVFGVQGTQGAQNAITASIAKDAIANLSKKSLEQHKLNEAASQTRFGGKFTESGLQMAHDNATLDAQDRIKARNMIVGQTGYATQEVQVDALGNPIRQPTQQSLGMGNF